MEPVTINLEQATVRFGDKTALDNFTGEFTPGTVTALIGGVKPRSLNCSPGGWGHTAGTTAGMPLTGTTWGTSPQTRACGVISQLPRILSS